jgi:hypothetical protein
MNEINETYRNSQNPNGVMAEFSGEREFGEKEI